MSYTVMNRIDVAAEGADAFEKRFAASMTATLPGVPGLVKSALLRPQAEGRPYVAVMEFTGEDAFRTWMSSESFKAAHGHSAEQQDAGAAHVEAFHTVAEVTA
ncbi:antibiotic biosynthesis monooxygenase family protein [Kitasatospora sp. HPMI-4]|uniref:antibiotic biosynthesis monooxygenase family protein n=1 Tax=Kitasatospora sp. HPMI-4 TaxID=3448443 RepID=UPI003F1B9B0C